MSQLFGYAATLASIIGFQLKKQSSIIMSQFFGNVFVALSYILLGGTKMVGGALCIVGGAQTLAGFYYMKKGKSLPKKVSVIFLIIYLIVFGVTLMVSEKFIFPNDILPLIAVFAFMIGVAAKNATGTRCFFLINAIIWIVYDVCAKPIAFGNLINHICILISILIGILRYDIIKKQDKI